MEKEKILLIINPVSGKRTPLTKTTILQELQNAEYDITEYETVPNWENDHSLIVHEHQYDVIVCCGGDGTMNSLINYLLKNNLNIPVLYVPTGTTNDFAKSLCLSNKPSDAITYLDKRISRHLDVGLFNQQRYFSYIASAGAFTDVSYTTSQKIKNLFGHRAYVVQGITSFAKEVESIYATIQTDDAEYQGEFLFLSITNSTSIGGVISIESKDVDFNDGIFEGILIRKPKNAPQMHNTIKALINKTYTNEDVCEIEFFHSTKISIQTEAEIAWTLDGEYAGKHSSVVIDVLPNKIELICSSEQLK